MEEDNILNSLLQLDSPQSVRRAGKKIRQNLVIWGEVGNVVIKTDKAKGEDHDNYFKMKNYKENKLRETV